MTAKASKSTSKSKVEAGQALREVDAPFYRYWQALYLSFFCNRLYIDVGKRWKGFGIGYLFLLIAVVTLPLNLRLVYEFNQYYDSEIIGPLKQLPQLYIQNGIVSLDKPMPYLIKNKADEVVLVVDTTGQVDRIDSSHYPHMTMLITRDQFLYRLPSPHFFTDTRTVRQNDQVYAQPFGPEMNQVFSGAEWMQSSGIERVKWASDFMIFPMVITLFFTMALVFFLACTFMSQLFAKLFIKAALTYKQSCRLFIVSSTPALTVLMVSVAINFRGAFLGLVILLLFAIYYYFAVFALKRESIRLVVS